MHKHKEIGNTHTHTRLNTDTTAIDD